MALKKFSIHASAKEATPSKPTSHQKRFFQSTPPRRRRHGFAGTNSTIQHFQSTPPRRRRLETVEELDYSIAFSIHASAKEATARGFFCCACWRFFNPRLREGGDATKTDTYMSISFSIHASAKEATPSCSVRRIAVVFSIHASAKEATGDEMLYGRSRLIFQSTPPRRRRLY